MVFVPPAISPLVSLAPSILGQRGGCDTQAATIVFVQVPRSPSADTHKYITPPPSTNMRQYPCTTLLPERSLHCVLQSIPYCKIVIWIRVEHAADDPCKSFDTFVECIFLFPREAKPNFVL